MAKHSDIHYTYAARKREKTRTQAQLERYYGKRALAETWKDRDPRYWRELTNEADKLHETLVLKGVL